MKASPNRGVFPEPNDIFAERRKRIHATLASFDVRKLPMNIEERRKRANARPYFGRRLLYPLREDDDVTTTIRSREHWRRTPPELSKSSTMDSRRSELGSGASVPEIRVHDVSDGSLARRRSFTESSSEQGVSMDGSSQQRGGLPKYKRVS